MTTILHGQCNMADNIFNYNIQKYRELEGIAIQEGFGPQPYSSVGLTPGGSKRSLKLVP